MSVRGCVCGCLCAWSGGWMCLCLRVLVFVYGRVCVCVWLCVGVRIRRWQAKACFDWSFRSTLHIGVCVSVCEIPPLLALVQEVACSTAPCEDITCFGLCRGPEFAPIHIILAPEIGTCAGAAAKAKTRGHHECKPEKQHVLEQVNEATYKVVMTAKWTGKGGFAHKQSLCGDLSYPKNDFPSVDIAFWCSLRLALWSVKERTFQDHDVISCK